MQGQPAVLTFRWGVDETAMAAGKGKELTITDLSLVEIGTPADGVKWPYPFAAVSARFSWLAPTSHPPLFPSRGDVRGLSAL